jgi:hypothetical protein
VIMGHMYLQENVGMLMWNKFSLMLWLHAMLVGFQMPLPLMLTLATCTTSPQQVLGVTDYSVTRALVGSPLSILCKL